MKIGIIRGDGAFLPEVEAYLAAFGALPGVSVSAYPSIENVPADCDVTIVFCGLIPFWKRPPGRLVAEYHSLSTGRWARIKNIVKRIVNARGDHYVFLNGRVRSGFFFSRKSPHSIRCMGYDPGLAAKYATTRRKHNFVYCGSIRPGVIGSIERLARLGFSVAVAGASGADHERLCRDSTGLVRSMGRVSLDRAYALMAESEYGLNFTPDRYPYNIQDSTKVLEYLGLGLKVVTNRYQWIDEFEHRSGARMLDIDNVLSRSDVTEFGFSTGDIAQWSWPRVIDRSGMVPAILSLASGPK